MLMYIYVLVTFSSVCTNGVSAGDLLETLNIFNRISDSQNIIKYNFLNTNKVKKHLYYDLIILKEFFKQKRLC